MKSVFKKSYAKVNLYLDITGKRDDGYHDIESVMQKISLHDNVVIKRDYFKKGINLKCNIPFIPKDERNICYKIAKSFFEVTGYSNQNILIDISKRIPVGAGLGGGSSNGAATLMGLCELYSITMSYKDMIDIAKNTGADVPFFLFNNAAFVTGIGEKITDIKPLKNAYILLLKPNLFLSTKEVYTQYDFLKNQSHSSPEKMLESMKNGDITGVCDNVFNTLETVCFLKNPILKELKEKLILNGAKGALMSGTGSTVFGIFDNEKSAKTAYNKLKNNKNFCFLCKCLD